MSTVPSGRATMPPVLRHAPLIPAGMEAFHWNPPESAGMGPESAGMGPESAGMGQESAGMDI
jgi:hypothetical protein